MRSTCRLLILNPTCLDVLEAHRDYLNGQPIEWAGDEAFRSLQPDRLDEVLGGAQALILPSAIRGLPQAEQMERYRALRVLSIAANGYDWLDLDAATRCGIVVTNAPIGEGVAVVAEMTWGLMLAVARQIPHHDRQIRLGQHDRGMGVALLGKTLGIVGLGKIGQAMVRRAAGFQMRVVAAEPSPDRAFAREFGVEVVGMDELLRQSDFVSLHVRLNSRTEGMIAASELARMKPSAFLINTARARLVDEEALARAIVDGQIAGAALDDPPACPDSPLLGLPNVVFTPHLGNRAAEGVHAVFRRAIDNAVAVLAGRRPENVLNPQVYDSPAQARRLREGDGRHED